MKALSHIDQFDPERPVRPWLHGIATRTVLKFLREGRRRRAREQRAARSRPEPSLASTGLERREEQLLVEAGIHSRRRAMETLGVEDPEAELGRVREEG